MKAYMTVTVISTQQQMGDGVIESKIGFTSIW